MEHGLRMSTVVDGRARAAVVTTTRAAQAYVSLRLSVRATSRVVSSHNCILPGATTTTTTGTLPSCYILEASHADLSFLAT